MDDLTAFLHSPAVGARRALARRAIALIPRTELQAAWEAHVATLQDPPHGTEAYVHWDRLARRQLHWIKPSGERVLALTRSGTGAEIAVAIIHGIGQRAVGTIYTGAVVNRGSVIAALLMLSDPAHERDMTNPWAEIVTPTQIERALEFVGASVREAA